MKWVDGLIGFLVTGFLGFWLRGFWLWVSSCAFKGQGRREGFNAETG